MTYWRMQLHPADPDQAVKHCVESLASGYIGLDFGKMLAISRTSVKKIYQVASRITCCSPMK